MELFGFGHLAAAMSTTEVAVMWNTIVFISNYSAVNSDPDGAIDGAMIENKVPYG